MLPYYLKSWDFIQRLLFCKVPSLAMKPKLFQNERGSYLLTTSNDSNLVSYRTIPNCTYQFHGAHTVTFFKRKVWKLSRIILVTRRDPWFGEFQSIEMPRDHALSLINTYPDILYNWHEWLRSGLVSIKEVFLKLRHSGTIKQTFLYLTEQSQ